MITIEDLLRPNAWLREFAFVPEMDPLTEEGALQEAQLLDVRFDALRSTVGLLFELRTALQLREANAGVLVAHQVRELSWVAERLHYGDEPPPMNRMAWTVGGSIPRSEDRLFSLMLGLWPGAQLELRAASVCVLRR